MLSPYERTALFDTLRPPPGYVLDQAVGTSFTLDLEALLTAPIAFALFASREADSTDDELEPVGLLEAIRRHADRITMFAQAGQIAVPARHRTVFAWLEGAVREVRPPRLGHLFHPKIWVVRYRVSVGDRRVLRLLCGTRNLTFDTSWDTLLCLESDPYVERPATTEAGQQSVAELVRALPSMAVLPVDDGRLAALHELANDLAAVPLAVPEPFESVQLHVLGREKATIALPPDDTERAVVVSPFLSEPWLRRFAATSHSSALVSREESLDRMPRAVLDSFDRLAVLNPVADMGPGSDGSSVDDGADPGRLFGGLHAKLFAFDTPRGATVFTGSANATDAAFSGNVEVVAELNGPADVGVARLLADSPGEPSFDTLLVDYAPLPEPVGETEAERLELALDDLRRRFASVSFTARVCPNGDDFQLGLTSDGPLPSVGRVEFAAADVRATVRPATLADRQAATALSLGEPADARFGVTLEGISAFFVITLTAELDDVSATTSCVVTARLCDAPPDRQSRLLAAMLRDPDRLLRYLLLLLADTDPLLGSGGGDAASRWLHGWSGAGWDDLPLLELLVRAADRFPDRLDHIDHLMRDLGVHGETVLPPGFEAVWDPVMQYHQQRAAQR
jgi:hypothetical protein